MTHNRNGQTERALPDPEVEPRAVRRQFTAEYKQRILDEIDRADQPGEIGAILRREGLYSQIVSKWRQQRAGGGLEGLAPKPRGPRAQPEGAEMERLKRENAQLRKKLAQAEQLLELQKKISQLVDWDENDPPEPKSSRSFSE